MTAWAPDPAVEMEADSVDTVVATLAVSDRLSLLPRSSIHDHDHLLTALPIDVPQPSRAIGLTTRVDWLPTPCRPSS